METFIDGDSYSYHGLQNVINGKWKCGFCSHLVSSDKGYGLMYRRTGLQAGGVYICPNCLCASFKMPDGRVFPGPLMGSHISFLPDEVASLYEEARRCSASNCFTACVLLCRKILMNTAVTQGASSGGSFISYVEFLSTAGYIPPNGRLWVDKIRTKGNEATHEIIQMSSQDAKDILLFTEMLLKFVYEFPAIANNTGS